MDESRFERNLPWSGWEMGRWIVRGLTAAKKVTEAVFGTVPDDGSSANGARKSSVETSPRDQPLPDRDAWDPRLNDLKASVASLAGTGADCANLTDAQNALASAQQSADLERLRDRLAPPGKLVTVNNRSDSLFAKWRFFDRGLSFFDPDRTKGGDYTKDGLEVPIPFQIYDADTLVIHGSADLGYVKRQLRGSGLVPVRDQNGQGFVEIWIMDYPDTCLGPYREAAIHVVAAADSTPESDLIYVRRDGFGCEVPILNPDTKLFTLSILLSEMSAIAYGEQLFGIKKDYVDARMDRIGDAKSFKFFERDRQTGTKGAQPFFWGNIRERDGLARKVLSLAALTQAAGALEVARDTLQAMKMETFTSTIVGHQLPNFAGACNGFVEILADYKVSAMLTEVHHEDIIGWETNHEFGAHLEAMRFVPQLLARDPHLRSVLYTRNWLRYSKRLEALAYASRANPRLPVRNRPARRGGGRARPVGRARRSAWRAARVAASVAGVGEVAAERRRTARRARGAAARTAPARDRGAADERVADGGRPRGAGAGAGGERSRGPRRRR